MLMQSEDESLLHAKVPYILEARLVEEGQKPEVVDALNVEIEKLDPEEKPLRRWIRWGCSVLIVVVVL